MATKHREVVLNKAIKYHDQAAERFDRNVDLINKAMERIIDLLDKTDNRISLLIKLNTEMTNLEAVIENEGG